MEDGEGSAPAFFHSGLRLPPELLVPRGIEEFVAGPGHSLGPPLTGNDLVRLQEAGVMKKPEVVVNRPDLESVVDEGAPAGGTSVGAFKVEEYSANQIEIAFHESI